MAYEAPAAKLGTLVAGADLSARQYTFVKLDSDGAVVGCTVAGEKALGVLQNKPLAGQACEIVTLGVTKIKGGGNVAKGALVMSAVTTGKAATAATTGSTILGWMLNENPSADNEIGTMYYNGATGVV